MSRSIKIKDQPGVRTLDPPESSDPYVSKLIKLIPAEIIGVYLSVFNLIGMEGESGPSRDTLHLIVFGLILVITPFYLKRVAKIKENRQIVFCVFAFVIWVFTLGGPIENLAVGPYSVKFLGAIFLPIYTLLIPLFYDTQTE